MAIMITKRGLARKGWWLTVVCCSITPDRLFYKFMLKLSPVVDEFAPLIRRAREQVVLELRRLISVRPVG